MNLCTGCNIRHDTRPNEKVTEVLGILATGAIVLQQRLDSREDFVFISVVEPWRRETIAGNGSEGNGTHGGQATSSALEQVRGIAFRPDGSFFVCTHKGAHAVWFVDTAGQIWKLIDGGNNDHNGDGTPITDFPQNAISEPRAVAIAPNGDLLITENDNGFIRRVTNICVEPQILAFDGETGQFTWTTHREGDYLLQRSTDLRNWTTAMEVSPSNGPTTSVTLSPDDPVEFFRATEIE